MRTLIHTCDACNKEIERNQGDLVILMADVESAREALKRQALRENSAPNPQSSSLAGTFLGALRQSSLLAQWHTYHVECYDSGGEATQVRVCLERVRTHEDLLAWHAHLFEKNWMSYTNWSAFLTRYNSGVPD